MRTNMREINPDTPTEPLDEDIRTEIAALATRQARAGRGLMRIVNLAGDRVEDGMRLLPKPARARIETAARGALSRSYDIASRTRAPGNGAGALEAAFGTDRAARVMATLSGALGGVGGLTTALAELPVATTMIFRAVQRVAEANGEDPLSEETRAECLRVFGAGGPGGGDDGIDTAFLGARLGLSGVAVNRLISRIAPRFATVLGQKLAGQAVPILGAAAGAGTNYAFTDYYVEVAHVHFGLRRLARLHGEERVLEAFHAELDRHRMPVRRG
ncbi:EcsC family protein [Limimaricola cinnabarinus]|uniref:EcsC family protein n=1 Tax=Limimaricola cinnabarinus TaxID=1125964 RepID=UPI0024920756|nr:EcsC family protein [Limimaricola cinnabarinus]